MTRSFHICNNELQTLQICVMMIYKHYLGPLQNLMRKILCLACPKKVHSDNIEGFSSLFQ